VEETNDMYLDVFSCKEFDPHVVVGVIADYFKPAEVNTRFLVRKAPELR
jgi:S-adenosylmethionine/arginine decarboxylase-like enzyme